MKSPSLVHRLLPVARMLLPFVGREVREQYAGSRLGLTWSLLQPALLVLLYWWVFAEILQTRVPGRAGTEGDLPFIAFLLSGLLPWFAFSDGINRGAIAVVARRDVVKNVVLPAQVFPLAAVTAAFATHMAGFGLFLAGFFLWRGLPGSEALLAVGLLLGMQLLATAGLALLFSALTVYLRDVQQVLAFALQLLFYTAPVLYPMDLVPEGLRTLVQINPFTGFAVAYHDAILWGLWPGTETILRLGVISLALFLIGRHLFRRLQPGFPDVL